MSGFFLYYSLLLSTLVFEARSPVECKAHQCGQIDCPMNYRDVTVFIPKKWSYRSLLSHPPKYWESELRTMCFVTCVLPTESSIASNVGYYGSPEERTSCLSIISEMNRKCLFVPSLTYGEVMLNASNVNWKYSKSEINLIHRVWSFII